MATKYTTETFKEKLKLLNCPYTLCDGEEYTNRNINHKFYCKEHDTIFEKKPDHLLHSFGTCPICERNKRSRQAIKGAECRVYRARKAFIDRANKIHNNRYGYEDTVYITSKLKIQVNCPDHGPFWIRASAHVYHQCQGCPKCAREKITQCIKEASKQEIIDNANNFVERSNIIHNNKYGYKDAIYMGCNKPIIITCLEHGPFTTTPTIHLNGSECPKCAMVKKRVGIDLARIESNKKAAQCFVEKAKVVWGDTYIYDNTEYKDSVTKVQIICKEHGPFWITPSNHLGHHGCPSCNESKGEKFIANWLKSNNLIFKPQKRFDTCRDKNKLAFDFHIEGTKILIEYDGKQHYEPIKRFGDIEGFKDRQRKDHIKYKWTRDNGFILIRLDYLMSDQEKIDMLESIKGYLKK